MTPQQGRGVKALREVADFALERLNRSDAAGIIDALSDEEFADMLEAVSAAAVARGETGNLLFESAAKRLRRPVALTEAA